MIWGCSKHIWVLLKHFRGCTCAWACCLQVGEFKALALRAEADAQLRQLLQTMLKLPKDKWDECVEHAKRAVFPDNRPRAWYADRTQSVGLLFPANLGVVDLKRPEGALADCQSRICQINLTLPVLVVEIACLLQAT